MKVYSRYLFSFVSAAPFCIPSSSLVINKSKKGISFFPESFSIPQKQDSKLKMLPINSEKLPSNFEILPSKFKLLPSKSKLLPSKSKMLPSKSKLLPSKSKLLPSKFKLLPSNFEILPSKLKMLPRKLKKQPSKFKKQGGISADTIKTSKEYAANPPFQIRLNSVKGYPLSIF